MFFDISLGEILLILIVTLMVVGPERIPDIARKAGRLLRDARRAGNMLRDIMTLEDEDDTPERRREMREHEIEARKKNRVPNEPGPIDDADDAEQVPGTVARQAAGGHDRPPVRPVLLVDTRPKTDMVTVDIEPPDSLTSCRSIDLNGRASAGWS